MEKTPPGERIPELWYPNIDFDLTLGGGGRRAPTGSQLEAVAREVGLWFWALARPGDAPIAPRPPPEEHLEYLERSGLAPPALFEQSSDPTPYRARAWGWNQDAAETLKLVCQHPQAPDPKIVRAVNSRRFSIQVSQSIGADPFGAKLIERPSDLEAELENTGIPAVLKPEFGNSGLGFIHVLVERDREPALRRMKKAAPDTCWVLEPWVERVLDIATGFFIERDGQVSRLSANIQTNSPRGVFESIDLPPTLPHRLEPWIEELERAARGAAAALFEAGYHGPVGIDSFIWRDSHGRERIAPLVEINARHTMRLFPGRIGERFDLGERFFRLRSINSRELRLPESYSRWKTLCGAHRFRPESGDGILLISPLRLREGDGRLTMPRRYGVILCARSADQLEELDRFLLERFAVPGL